MPGPIVNLFSVPTGGAVLLQFPEYIVPPSGVTSMSISIAVSGAFGIGPYTQVYSGATQVAYLDVGDVFSTPLDPTTSYVYAVSDQRGVTITPPVTPAWAIETQPDQLSQIMLRLLQGAVNSMPLPAGVSRVQVSTEMPQNGLMAMPFIVLNLDLLQQTEVQIGEDVPNPDLENNWAMFANAKRVWRVTVMSRSTEERDFYRDTLLMAFRAMKATAFSPLGYNVTHSFQAASYTDVKEYEGVAPGFYGADLMLEIDGIFPVVVLTGYGPIRAIDGIATVLPPPGETTIGFATR